MDIREILDFETKKILEILRLLQQSTKELSFRTLAEELSVHVKTVARYVEKIQRLLVDYGMSRQLSLTVRKKLRLVFVMENPWYLERFRIFLIQRAPEMVILEKTIHSSSFTIKELSVQLEESEPQVKKRLTKIRRWLQPLKLTLRRNTFELIGNELQIRGFIQQFYRITAYHQENIDQYLFSRKAERICQEIALFFHLRLNYLQEKQLWSLAYIQLVRVKKRKTVALDESLKKYCLNSVMYSSFVLQLQSKGIQEFSAEENMYLFLIVQAMFAENFSQSLKEKFIYENYANKTAAHIQTAYGAEMLKNSFNEHEFLFDKHVYTSLLSFHLYYELSDFLPYEDLSFFKQLAIAYPVSFHKLNQGIRGLSKMNDHFQKIPKAQLLLRYFYIFSEMVAPVLLERQKNIYLVLDWGPEQKKHLIQRISSHFKNRRNIRFVEGRIYSEYKNADVILTTAIHSFFIEQRLSCPVLTIINLPEGALLDQLEIILAD
ncbi:helix-turn-helix domain-containing protein [Enterococcus sp. BWM-S5]|uniref:Helix-turn-helix domain-containing protein n=1 Tax=Enterococcus larvae TaxID=2794352 RepID=A0ABS4CFU3_9ENTE|nr:helix-turn-helix domain-containing protein [Enterococcus larvae]MBP1044709.1 helix-turn-helix domain-containing protein [Enterococcus larvae]